MFVKRSSKLAVGIVRVSAAASVAVSSRNSCCSRVAAWWRSLPDHFRMRPTTTPPSVVTTLDPANTLPPPMQYTIVKGDSVYGIASKFGIAPDELAAYNNWPEGVLHPLAIGASILIPPSANQTTTLPGLPLPVDSTTPSPDNTQYTKYTVVEGDCCISRIADKLGVEASALMAANGWVDASVVILPGDEINVPPPTKDPKP
ncbi:MAG: LysM peptidoglycan-binding domain-containing protein [Actinobacteria bacterium]|nr:LysM peptidoglycan-binding domain-containing protein [Actinomycetota bacterium]